MRAATLVGLALLGACGKGDKDSGGEPLSPDLVMGDENSYSYTGDMTIGSVDVASATDSTVDWCSLTTDIRGRPVVPGEIDRLVLIEVAGTQEEVVALIEGNDLDQEVTVTQWIHINEQADCTANLSEFSILANDFPVDEFVPSENTWLLSATYYDAGRFDFVMTTFVVPVDGEPNTSVELTDASSTLVVDADLHSLTPMRTGAGLGDYTFDWSAVTKDVYGDPYDDQIGNQVLIGKVPFDDIAQVEEAFLRVDSEAEELYRLNVVDGIPVVLGETSADLMAATDAAGNPFGGFTTDGIWLLGVECTSCTSPAPLLLGVVEVE